jgi:hypothetical protein
MHFLEMEVEVVRLLAGLLPQVCYDLLVDSVVQKEELADDTAVAVLEMHILCDAQLASDAQEPQYLL